MTQMKKGRDGWEAKDVIDFDGLYKLTIDTSKRSNGKGLISLATVSKHEDGFTTHRFGMGTGGDYSERLIVTGVRCTDKTVAAQHAEAMRMLDAVIAAAKAHYVKYPIRG